MTQCYSCTPPNQMDPDAIYYLCAKCIERLPDKDRIQRLEKIVDALLQDNERVKRELDAWYNSDHE